MTDHADTIRALIAALKEGWPDESTVAGNYTRRELVSALDELVAERQQATEVARLLEAMNDNLVRERQQAINERDAARSATQDADRAKWEARAERQQAIDAYKAEKNKRAKMESQLIGCRLRAERHATHLKNLRHDYAEVAAERQQAIDQLDNAHALLGQAVKDKREAIDALRETVAALIAMRSLASISTDGDPWYTENEGLDAESIFTQAGQAITTAATLVSLGEENEAQTIAERARLGYYDTDPPEAQ